MSTCTWYGNCESSPAVCSSLWNSAAIQTSAASSTAGLTGLDAHSVAGSFALEMRLTFDEWVRRIDQRQSGTTLVPSSGTFVLLWRGYESIVMTTFP